MSVRFRNCVIGLLGLIPLPMIVEAAADEKPKNATVSPVPESKEKTAKTARTAKSSSKLPRMLRSDRFWRTKLDPGQYYVTRRKGTEQAFSGMYWNHHEDGIYACIGCGTPLFDSEAKFDSGTGWPSYWQVISRNYLKTHPDLSSGLLRTEVNCRVCDAHLGHVFDDGPRPTGLRYCINSASINFVAREDLKEYIDDWRKAIGLPPLEPEPTAEEKKPETEPSPVEKPVKNESTDAEKNTELRESSANPGR